MKLNLFFISFLLSADLFSQPVLSIDTFATDIGGGPIGLVNCGDDRLFAVCQDGYIMILDTLGNINPVPFLDIDARVESDANAHGLLGVVFHPDYFSNGFFYVNYINNDMNSVIARFSVSAGDPDIADTTSELIMLTVEQPYNVHKAGDMHFGPDGYLYFPFGDGGVATPGGPGDPDNRAQNPQTYLGKMLRIDVNGALPYEIPTTNPFYGAADTLNEIWAIGLRNPWRFSFDRLTGEMWLPDVGHDLWEEVNFEAAGFTGGNNYGWRCYEGNAEYNFDSCDATGDYTFPIHVYPHDDSTGGYSVTGGYVYRGSNYPGLDGKYLYCDYVSGNFYTLEPDGAGGWINTIYMHLLENVVSFGEDKNGELYCVVRAGGMIYKIGDKCNDFHVDATIGDADCVLGNIGTIDLAAAGGAEPYEYNWASGDTTAMIDSLADGFYIVTITDTIGCAITDSFYVALTDDFEIDYTMASETIYVDEIPGATYLWFENDDLNEDATSYYYTVTLDFDGIITCVVTNAMGCVDTIIVDFTPEALSMSNKYDVLIYPNPSSDHLTIRYEHLVTAEICISNAFGQQVVAMRSDTNGEIDIQSLPEGVYFCWISIDGDVVIKTFTIQR